MKYLYLITESKSDALFFEGCLERLTGWTFQVDPTRRRLRKGEDISFARQMTRQVLREIRHTGTMENVYLVIAVDNDRAPQHPSHERVEGLPEPDQNKGCRVCEIQAMVVSELGEDSSKWPVEIAIAVPVEMLESWLLLVCSHKPDTLPLFSRSLQKGPKQYYAPHAPPEQLKDLCQKELQRRTFESMADFCLECATELLDPDDLAKKSPSFTLFKDQVERWS